MRKGCSYGCTSRPKQLAFLHKVPLLMVERHVDERRLSRGRRALRIHVTSRGDDSAGTPLSRRLGELGLHFGC